jgi:hypothetical protein
MFKGLMSFEMTRTGVQALGFYIVYFLIGLLIGGLAGTISGLVVEHDASAEARFAEGLRWGIMAVIPYVLAMGLTVVIKKKLGLGYYALCIVCACVAAYGGAFIGLMPIAFMTTRPTREAVAAE